MGAPEVQQVFLRCGDGCEELVNGLVFAPLALQGLEAGAHAGDALLGIGDAKLLIQVRHGAATSSLAAMEPPNRMVEARLLTLLAPLAKAATETAGLAAMVSAR